MDRGANGGAAGDDLHVIPYCPNRKADALGIDNHTVNSISVVTASEIVEITAGPIIVILHQYACMGRGNSIYSSIQMEHFKSAVDEKTIKAGGKQHIITNDNYVSPLTIKNGLPYLDIQPHANN